MRPSRFVVTTIASLAVILTACEKKATTESSCTNSTDAASGTEAASTATDCQAVDGSAQAAASQPQGGGLGGQAGASDTTAPTPGTGPTFSDITKTGFTVSWEGATDNTTAAANLEYQLVYASSTTSLSTLAEAEAISPAGIALAWKANELSKAVTGLSPSESQTYAVLVRDAAGNSALYPGVSVTTLAEDAPTPGAGITFDLITDTNFSVYWGAATSTISASENLLYRVVMASNSASISTVAQAEAVSGSNVILDWTANRTGTYTPSGSLQGAHAYAVAVLVKDENGTTAIYTPQTVTTLHHKLIYITTTPYNPSLFGDMTVADDYCNNGQQPAGRGTFKAMLVKAGLRVACLHADCSISNTILTNDGYNWIMTPNTSYENRLGELIWTTNAAGVVSRSQSTPGAIDAADYRAWTGLNSNWTVGSNCAGWTSNSVNDNGTFGRAPSNNGLSWSWVDNQHCNDNSAAGLYCVEQ